MNHYDPEEWKDIPGYEGKYQARRDGKIRRLYKNGGNHILVCTFRRRPKKGSDYLRVKLAGRDGVYHNEKVSRIVWETFVGPKPKGMALIHRNGAPGDNSLSNLKLVTRQELGKTFGRKTGGVDTVVRVDMDMNPVGVYSSARAAARECFSSYQTILDRCNGKVKKAPAPDGYEYHWETIKRSENKCRQRVEEYRRKNGMPELENAI